MANARPRFGRRRRAGADSAAPRPLGCLWPVFWLILIIILLGLLFGGYRKGSKIGAPAPRPHSLAAGSIRGLPCPPSSRAA